MLLVIVALICLLLVPQSREIMRGMLGWAFWINDGLGGYRLGLRHYLAMYGSTLLLAASVWISTLMLENVSRVGRVRRVRESRKSYAIIYGWTTLTVVHCAVLNSFFVEYRVAITQGIVLATALAVIAISASEGLSRGRVVGWLIVSQCLVLICGVWQTARDYLGCLNFIVAEVCLAVIPIMAKRTLEQGSLSRRYVAWMLGCLSALLACIAYVVSDVEYREWYGQILPESKLSTPLSPFSFVHLSSRLVIVASALTPLLALLWLWATGQWAMRSVAPMSARQGRIGLLLLVVLTVVPLVSSDVWAIHVGSLAVVLTWLTWVVAVLGWFTLARRKLRAPGLVVLVLAVGVVYLLYREKMGTEVLEAEPLKAEVTSQSASELGERVPAVVPVQFAVHADGGGLRAAAFTALVLAQADDITCGKFGDQVFSASGVSGGSLGIATWAVMRQAYMQKQGVPPWGACRAEPINEDTQHMHLTTMVFAALVQDHLSTSLFGTLTYDLLPLGSTAYRGQSLLESWQKTAKRAVTLPEGVGSGQAAHEVLAMRLSEVAAGVSERPLLLFTATDADSGQPIVFSNDGARLQGSGMTVIDGTQVSIGQAVLHSARFPFISPAGEIKLNGMRRRLVDGGYFDNSGATTLVNALRVVAERERGTSLPQKLVVLRINGNPPPADMQCNFLPTFGDTGATINGWSTYKAYTRVRDAHGDEAMKQLRSDRGLSEVLNIDDKINVSVIFRMCGAAKSAERVPLGWYLAPESGVLLYSAARQAAFDLIGRIQKIGPPASSAPVQ